MDWKDRLAGAKALTDKASRLVLDEARALTAASASARLAAAERARITIEGQWPRVASLFRDHLQRPTATALNDDQLMRRVLPLVYEGLPLLVRVAVQEEDFITFCLDNRCRLVLPEAATAGASTSKGIATI